MILAKYTFSISIFLFPTVSFDVVKCLETYVLKSVLRSDRYMSLINFREQLLKLKDFNEAFELVKLAVNIKFNIHRAGLSLILQGLPSRIGAYHILGSNIIVANRTILNIIQQHKSTEEYNSYLFMVLTHEYLHSFGIVDEFRVRQMTYDLCSSLLGNEHAASIMAKEDPSALFPELILLRENRFDKHFEVVKNFDKTNQSYIQ